MNRNTPRAHRSPTVSANPPEMKKKKQTVRESSSPRRIIKKKKQPTPLIPPPGDDRERDAIAEATLLHLPIHKTTLISKAQENVAKVQAKLDEEEIDKLVKGNADEESYASAFVDSMFNDKGDDVDDTANNKETEKENEEVGNEQNIVVTEVVEIEKETNVDAEKTNTIVKEIEITYVSGSPQNKLFKCYEIKTAHGPNMIEELFRQHMQNTTPNLYPKTSSSNATKSSIDIQQQLYLTIKVNLQDQVADPEIWEILKAKFE
ncbi:hypothetical protein Tco_0080528 [Tanacetum coccineum]